MADAAILRAALPAPHFKLILDNRVDLIGETGFDGVHVDAGDLPPAEARRLLGPDRIIGTFGGSEAFLPGVLDAPVDYLAIGPAYPTTTKQTTKAPIGPEGVRKFAPWPAPGTRADYGRRHYARHRPVATCGAGATSVAVASALSARPIRWPSFGAGRRNWGKVDTG